MYYVLVFVFGVIVGGTVMFFVYKNNEKKFTETASQLQVDLDLAKAKLRDMTGPKTLDKSS